MPTAGILIPLPYPASAWPALGQAPWPALRSDACGSDNAEAEKIEQAVALRLAEESAGFFILPAAFLRIIDGPDWVGDNYAVLCVSLVKAFDKFVLNNVLVNIFPRP